MKRIALLTVLLLVVGLSLGFAQEFKPTMAWSTAGSATLTWGINLDTMETGFTNATAGQFTLTFIPAATLAKGAEAPVYGSISLAVTAETVTDAGGFTWTATGVTATIQAKPFEIGISTAPSHTLGGSFTVIDSTANFTDIVGVLNHTETALATAVTGPGTYLKFISSMITVQASIISTDALWATRAKDTEIQYAGGLDATLVFAPVTLGFGAWMSMLTGATPIAYATVSTAAIGPLTASAWFDISLLATPAWDLGANIALAFTPKTSLTLGAQYGDVATFNGLDVKAVLATTEVANLTETLTAYVLDITSTTGMRLSVDNTLSYLVKLSDTTSITPSLQVNFGQFATGTNALKVVAAVSMALIPNTTIALTYTSGDFLATTVLIGKVTCAVTVAY